MLKRILLPLMAIAVLAACEKKEETTVAPESATPPAAAPATPAPAAEAPAPAAPAETPAAPAGDVASGETIYKKTCFLCHGTGAGGAPMLTDKADWQTRVAQGNDTLYKHAIEGYTGSKGMMPPKGGNASLTDAEVKAAVDYMVAQAK